MEHLRKRDEKNDGKVASRKPRLTAAPTLLFFFVLIFFHFSSIPQIFSRPSNVKSICAVRVFVCVCVLCMCVYVLEMGSRSFLKTASEEAAAEVCLS